MTLDCSTADRASAAHVRIDRALEQLRAGLHDSVCEMERLRGEIDDLRAANRVYAQLLTDVRAALGAGEDADLAEAARSLTAEVKQLIMQNILKRERAERVESECERLRQGIALARAYRAAVDGLNGAADAEAALFAWLGEVENV